MSSKMVKNNKSSLVFIYYFEHHLFGIFMCFCIMFIIKSASFWRQKSTKIYLKQYPKLNPISWWVLISYFVSFGTHEGALFGPKMAPKRPQDGPKRPQDGPRVPQDGLGGPKMAQEAPRWPQAGPKMAPRWPQEAPRWPQDGPKMAQEALRWPPRLANSQQKTLVKLIFSLVQRIWARPARPVTTQMIEDYISIIFHDFWMIFNDFQSLIVLRELALSVQLQRNPNTPRLIQLCDENQPDHCKPTEIS